MKKNTKNIITKALLLFSLATAQLPTWAADAGEPGKLSQAMSQPRFWIGLVLFIALIVTASLIGREKKETHSQ